MLANLPQARRDGRCAVTVVVLGGLNMDLIVETAVVAAPGETREGRHFFATPGGKGGNQAVAAARFLDGRVAVAMVGLVGDDTFGAELRDHLRTAGVDVARVRVTEGVHSGVAVIMIDAAGENSVNAVYGANTRCGDAQLQDVIAALDGAPAAGGPHVLLVQQETPLDTTVAAMRAARARGATVVLDPAPTRPDAGPLLALADLVTPNEHEAADLCGFPVHDAASARAAARALRARGAPVAIVTLGAAGAWVESATLSLHVPAPAVQAVATVGAGDAFNGALAGALALGAGLEAAGADRRGRGRAVRDEAGRAGGDAAARRSRGAARPRVSPMRRARRGTASAAAAGAARSTRARVRRWPRRTRIRCRRSPPWRAPLPPRVGGPPIVWERRRDTR